MLEWSWGLRGSPTTQRITTPSPFVVKNFVLLIFRHQQPIKAFLNGEHFPVNGAIIVLCYTHPCTIVLQLYLWFALTTTALMRQS